MSKFDFSPNRVMEVVYTAFGNQPLYFDFSDLKSYRVAMDHDLGEFADLLGVPERTLRSHETSKIEGKRNLFLAAQYLYDSLWYWQGIDHYSEGKDVFRDLVSLEQFNQWNKRKELKFLRRAACPEIAVMQTDERLPKRLFSEELLHYVGNGKVYRSLENFVEIERLKVEWEKTGKKDEVIQQKLRELVFG